MANYLQNSILLQNGKIKLPKTAKINKTKSGKLKPMTLNQAHQLYNKPLNFLSFRRIARRYYLTASCSNSKTITLKNAITGKAITLNISGTAGTVTGTKHETTPNGSYIFIDITLRNIHSNKDLFLKLIANKYV